MKKIIAVLGLIVCVLQPLSAQRKWGEVTPELFKIQSYQKFPDADAVILVKNGDLSPQSGMTGYELVKNHYLRIHILTEKGLENANQAIYYYTKDNLERIGKYRARTLNLEEGEIVNTVVKSKDFFKEGDLTSNYSALKFTFPNVKVGSILEFEYTIYRGGVFSENWYFQGELPTIYSEFFFTPHNKMSHVFLYQGLFNEKLVKTGQATWKMTNLPGLLEEPFVSNLDDYRPKLLVQLDAYVADGVVKKVLNTWEDLTKEVYRESDFGKLDKKKMKMDEVVETKIVNMLAEPEEKVEKIYKYVIENIKWNGNRRIFSKEILDKVFEKKEGSSAEVNLILTRMLRKAGIEAYPILLSTRRHGVVMKAYPLLVQFNTLACHAIIDGKPYLLDATNPVRPYTLPDPSLLNGEGWLMDRDNPRWVDISRNYKAEEHTIAFLNLAGDGNLSGEVTKMFSGYDAVDNREMLEEFEEEEFWEKHYKKHLTEGSIENTKLMKKDDISSSLTAKVELTTNDYSNIVGDFIYVKPMMMFGLEENPFKASKRYYPVDFVHQQKFQIEITINVPEGYDVESIPKSAQLVSQGRGMSFLYQCEQLSKTIQIKTIFEISNPVYNPGEYSLVKKMFDRMISRHSDQIVFKKRS